MSNFNQNPGQPNYQPQNYGQPYGQGQFNPPPQQNSGGGSTILIILAIIGGLFLLAMGFCLVMAYMVKSSVENFAGEVTSMAASAMTESVVSQYEEHEEVLARIGAIDSSELKDKDLGFEAFTKRKLEIEVSGDKGKGTIILYRKNGRPEKVTLLVDGEEILLDDKPEQSLGSKVNAEWEDPEFDSDTEIDPNAEGVDAEGADAEGSSVTNDESVGEHSETH